MTLASRVVLIIEDEPQIRRVLRTLLELEQFRVIEAETAERGLIEASTHKPDVVIIMLGTNDTKAQNWVHEDELSADYKDLIESFKNLDSKPRIFICRPCPVVGAGKYGINEANLDIEIPVIDKVAADEGVDEIDMHAALPGNTATQPDTVHPNAAGSALMAQAAANVLTGKTTP